MLIGNYEFNFSQPVDHHMEYLTKIEARLQRHGLNSGLLL